MDSNSRISSCFPSIAKHLRRFGAGAFVIVTKIAASRHNTLHNTPKIIGQKCKNIGQKDLFNPRNTIYNKGV